MSFINVNFMSHVLGMGCAANVILPQSPPENILKKPFKTLYLLHGLSDDHTAWARYTSIERYAAEYGITVVMPCVHRSFYSDSKYGRYFEFVSEELISIMEEMFPLSNKREDRYAAGLSMGGYGAMKLGLRCPERVFLLFEQAETPKSKDSLFANLARLLTKLDLSKLFIFEKSVFFKSIVPSSYIFLTCAKQFMSVPIISSIFERYKLSSLIFAIIAYSFVS